jgi:lipopolysaccharide transport system ATP-binding protein
MGKMADVGQHGRTMILVSHDKPAITRMCSRAILLNKGTVVEAGPAHDVVNHYLHAGHIQPCAEWPDPAQAPGNEIVRLRAVRAQTESGLIMDRFDIRRSIDLDVEFDVIKPRQVFVPVFNIHSEEDVTVFIAHDRDPACFHGENSGKPSRGRDDDRERPHDDRGSVSSPCACAASLRVPGG